MKLNKLIGEFNLLSDLTIFRGMKRADLFKSNLKWEEWMYTNDNKPTAYRIILSIKEFSKVGDIYLILYFQIPNEGVLDFWTLSPDKLMDGLQSKPEGKYTKRMRKWFLEACNVQLPVGGDWGHLDAAYDHWNGVTSIVCNYRDRFDTEERWNEYRKRNKF